MSTPTGDEPTADTVHAPPQDDEATGGSGAVAVVVGLLLVALVAVGALVGGLLLFRGDDGAPTEYVVDVPDGTAVRMARGEQIELIPQEVELSVGDTMVINNGDAQIHEVGPFTVRPGETLRYTFDEAGVYQGNCTVHPAGVVKIVVT